MNNVKNKYGRYNKDLIINSIAENKSFDLGKFYEIYDLVVDENDYEQYLIQLLTKKMIFDLSKYVQSLRKENNKREINN